MPAAINIQVNMNAQQAQAAVQTLGQALQGMNVHINNASQATQNATAHLNTMGGVLRYDRT